MSLRILAVIALTTLLSPAQIRDYVQDCFVSSEAELKLPAADPPKCVALQQAPVTLFMTAGEIAAAYDLHWAACQMNQKQMKAVRDVPGQEISPVFGWPISLVGPSSHDGHLSGMLMSRPARIPGIKSIGDLVTATQRYLATLWKPENLTFLSKYGGPNDVPLIEIEVSHIRGQVLLEEKYWEKLHLILWFSENTEERFEVVIAIDGFYAPGLGAAPPNDSELISLEPKYQSALEQYERRLSEQLREHYSAR